MTVLRRTEGAGVERSVVTKAGIGLAMLIVGVAAAFGLSRLIDDSTPAVPAAMAVRAAGVEANLETLQRTGLAQMEAMGERALMDLRYEIGEIQKQAVQASNSQSGFWSLENEIEALRNRPNAGGPGTGVDSGLR